MKTGEGMRWCELCVCVCVCVCFAAMPSFHAAPSFVSLSPSPSVHAHRPPSTHSLHAKIFADRDQVP